VSAAPAAYEEKIMSRSETEIQQVREIAGGVAQRLGSDPAFRSRLEADPVGILRTAGLPDAAIADVLQEMGASTEDVAGYALEVGPPVLGLGCVFTCVVTCMWSDGDPALGATKPGASFHPR
jgi:hypothetical protein